MSIIFCHMLFITFWFTFHYFIERFPASQRTSFINPWTKWRVNQLLLRFRVILPQGFNCEWIKEMEVIKMHCWRAEGGGGILHTFPTEYQWIIEALCLNNSFLIISAVVIYYDTWCMWVKARVQEWISLLFVFF